MDQTLDNPKPVRHSAFAVWCWPRWTRFAIVPMLAVPYVLSFGPVLWLNHHRYLPTSGVIIAFYAPLDYACWKFPLLGEFVAKYVEWWVP